MRKATNILWDYDMDTVLEALDILNDKAAAEKLGISKEKYTHMTIDERHDYACDLFHHCPGALDDFFDLPDEIEIPEELTDDEDISDWLSDEYGFCHEGFEIIEI